MSQSLYKNIVQIVFSTKNRIPFLIDRRTRYQVFWYLGRIATSLGADVLEVNGHHDHVHIVLNEPKDVLKTTLIKELKRRSTLWSRSRFYGLNDFAWQAGYGLFSVSPCQVEIIRAYVRNQEMHHETVDFKTEYLQLLRDNQMDFDLRYLWTP